MARPSKGAALFLVLFGLPFLGAGLFFIFIQLADPGSSGTGGKTTGIMFASVFVIIGAGLIYAAIGGYGRLKQQAAIEESNPLSPWLWRKDWASRRAESQNKKSEITYWVICILCNLILLPVVTTQFPPLARLRDPRAFLLLGFGLIGLILLVNALRATIRHRRFGDTYFEFNSLPFSPGDRVGGRIHLKFETQAQHGIDLRLSCVRKIITGTGKSQTTNQVVLWQADQNIPSGAVGPGPLGRAIPVDFALPPESLVTDHDNPNDQVLWLLHAQADIPGIDYSDDFELPVFRTASSPATARDSQSPASGADAFGFAAPSGDSDSTAVAQPAHTKVIVSMPLRRHRILFSAVSQSGPRTGAPCLHRDLERNCLFPLPFERAVVLCSGFRLFRSAPHLRCFPRHPGKRPNRRSQRRNSFSQRHSWTWFRTADSGFRRRLDSARGQHAAEQQLRERTLCHSPAHKKWAQTHSRR